MNTYNIDYNIYGGEMQYVEIELDTHETAIAEPGSFMMMDDGVQMSTIYGDGSKGSEQGGLFGQLFYAGKRILTGESLFLTAFINVAPDSKRKVAFASPCPGKIIPLDLQRHNKIICQKDAFLCAAKGISIGVEYQKKLGAGSPVGEDYIMQKIEGRGIAFLHAGGHVVEKHLRQADVIKVDISCIVGFTANVGYEIEFIRGVRNIISGGEGIYYAKLRGPGTVWIQSMPLSRFAGKMAAYSRKPKEEGSVLGS